MALRKYYVVQCDRCRTQCGGAVCPSAEMARKVARRLKWKRIPRPAGKSNAQGPGRDLCVFCRNKE